MSLDAEADSSLRVWRTNFLTLRDESLTPTERSALPLICHLILPHCHSLVAAASHLPPNEATSDLMYLMNLAVASSSDENDVVEYAHAFPAICFLIHDVAVAVSLHISSQAWCQLLDTFSNLVKFFLNSKKIIFTLGIATTAKAVLSCLDTSRRLIGSNPKRLLLTDDVRLLKFLLHVIQCSHAQLYISPHQFHSGLCKSDQGPQNISKWSCLWKIQAVAFSTVGEVFSRVGSSLPVEIWLSTVEVLRKVMDPLSARVIPLDDLVMPRYYVSILDCLHIVLTNRKGPLSDHVAAFIATLRVFLTGEFSIESQVPIHKKSDSTFLSNHLSLTEPQKVDIGRYRPPHLRRKSLPRSEAKSIKLFQENNLSLSDFASADSDYSDNERQEDDFQILCGGKLRVAAIMCIQDLCKADPKAFITHWTMLFPTNDVLHPRKCEVSLMTCLLFDPYMKARNAAASTIASMLDGASSVVLQVAEYKDPSKCGSYLSLSSSLGQILMQLHTGILQLVQNETHVGLLMSLFKILNLLITSTPYPRMPGELMPTILSSLQMRILKGFPYKNEQSDLLALAINCMNATLSVTPSSTHVTRMLQDEISTGFTMRRPGTGILNTLLHLADQAQNPTISLEALQTLRAVCHNYPDLMLACWEQVACIVKAFLASKPAEILMDKGSVGVGIGSCQEKVISAAVKVLDEFLRAISGFKGTEDAFDDNLVETPFISDCVRSKRISSAPSYGPGSKIGTLDLKSCAPGASEWEEAIKELLPLTLCHTSGLVRCASITCFAGMTSAVFCSLKQETRSFILSSCINAATKDAVSSVRSAACRAIGVIACFPDISRSAEILQIFFDAAETNTHHHLISVRIPASWAIANICSSLHNCLDYFPGFVLDIQTMVLISECALRLTKDGDKIKSNAVRALGNLSRAINFKCRGEKVSSRYGCEVHLSPASNCFLDMDLLDRIVQAFLSCITTGNVKVQWNVCHALSKLFLNENVNLQHMDWAPSVYSVLLVLLRDSSNYKVRIQAAAALAVPSEVFGYGRSFSDVVQGVEHVVENLGSYQTSSTSSFKYRIALEKQVTSTLLHVLSLCSTCGDEPLKEFLCKKVLFFEEWFKFLCVSLKEGRSHEDEVGVNLNNHLKADLLIKAMKSLIEVYESRDQKAALERLEKLLNDCLLVHFI